MKNERELAELIFDTFRASNCKKTAPIPKFAKELAILTTRKAANSKWKLKNCPPSKN